METVNKFIQIALIFDQKAFNQENACDSSMNRPGSYKRPQATSRVISQSQLNPFGIFVGGVFLTARTVVHSIFKNNKMSNVHHSVKEYHSCFQCSSEMEHGNKKSFGPWSKLESLDIESIILMVAARGKILREDNFIQINVMLST